ncbi:MAG: hypothetical protein LBI42_12480 [Chitinispirillales bacterium]|jgi:hypothetical protein|nr:hypothetical protein [Chitinispirillales bacterium]
MAIRNQELTVNFLVWDTENNCGKTGDAANITLKIIKDGAVFNVNAGRVTEVSAANTPGIYQIILTASEMDANFICVSGVSSSNKVVVYPAFIQTESGELVEIKNMLHQIKNIMPGGTSNQFATKQDVENAVNMILSQVSECKCATENVESNVNAMFQGGVIIKNTFKSDFENWVSDGVKQTRFNELTDLPTKDPTLEQAIMLSYMKARNKTVNNERELVIYRCGESKAVFKAELSDNGSVFTKSELKNT